jgi:hypothetical protein
MYQNNGLYVNCGKLFKQIFQVMKTESLGLSISFTLKLRGALRSKARP